MKANEKFKSVVIATINGVNILASAGDDELVPIRPICDLFGVASNKQIEKLKDNPLFSSVDTLRVSTGIDGKQYEMYCLPFEYCLAWMIGINAANVKPEVSEKLLEYQRECCAALKDHFFGKYRKQEKSFEKTAKLKVEKQSLLDNANKTEDLRRFLEIEVELKTEEKQRSNSSRETLTGLISFFSEKEMTGKP